MSQAAAVRQTLSDRTALAGRETLEGKRRGPLAFLPFAGPAIIASIAYVDPGNFATNIQAGAHHGYMLLWVVVVANAIAMLFQSLSARLGVASGESLATLCRVHFPRPVAIVMWILSEIAAMATDLAELVGAAIGISILFGLPLLTSLLITFGITWAFLSVQSRGFRPIELIITGFIGVIALGYLVELIIAPPDWPAFAFHSVVPQLGGGDSVTLAVGIVGATVMPHAIYLHSSLMRDRVPTHTDVDRRKVIKYSNTEVIIALGLAGLVNMAMVAMAARIFHQDFPSMDGIEEAYRTLLPLMGVVAAGAFMAALLASGVSSSVVGTMAGQTIMQDFLRVRVPLWLRRLVTMAPAVVVVAWGVDATDALVWSQVILSAVLPVPMVAMLLLLRRKDVMGSFVCGWPTTVWAALATMVVMALNAILLLQASGVSLDGILGV